MNFSFQNIFGPAEQLVRARLYAPNGSTVIELALTGLPVPGASWAVFSGSVAISPTPANSSVPYEFSIRVVSAQTPEAFDDAETYDPETGFGPIFPNGIFAYAINGVWGDAAVVTLNPYMRP
jgi:hypothetical protein